MPSLGSLTVGDLDRVMHELGTKNKRGPRHGRVATDGGISERLELWPGSHDAVYDAVLPRYGG